MRVSLVFIVLICTLFSCQEQKNCEELYNKFVESSVKASDEVSLELISKAIKCDSDNDDYKFEKIKVLNRLGRYSDALSTAETISLSPLSELTQGVITLKIDNSKGRSDLKDVLDKMQNANVSDDLKFSQDLNIIQLTYLIEGKQPAHELINIKMDEYDREYELNTLKAMSQFIDEKGPEELIFEIYDIRTNGTVNYFVFLLFVS